VSRKNPEPKAKKPEAPPAFRPFAALKDQLAAKAPPPPAKPAAPQPAPRSAPRPTAPSAPATSSDAELLRMYYAGAVPLGDKGTRVPRTSSQLEKRPLPPAAPAGVDPDAEARARLRALVEGKSTFEVVDDGLRIEGRRADVDPRALRKLRRGEAPIEATLDLHGLSSAEARREVEAFVAAERKAGARTVLVVHGKGNHSPGGQPVLRGELAAWLSEGAASVHVVGFTTARPEDGGSGATYVLLRP
jgi:DNA-nicking Smr family endonuclease